MRERTKSNPKQRATSDRPSRSNTKSNSDRPKSSATQVAQAAIGNSGLSNLLGTASDPEREADDVADKVLRCERDLGKQLSRQPAGPKLSLGRSEPLPQKAKSRLETAFSADLTAVRIHRGPEAQAATTAHSALAFASGVDIAISAAAPAVDSPAGFAMLAHEVAHVVQQTGALRDDGRLSLTSRHGDGRVARVSLPFSPTTSATPSLADILIKHMTAALRGKAGSRKRSSTDGKRVRTKAEQADIAVALKQIAMLAPGIAADDYEKLSGRYTAHFPNPQPTAISSFWSDLATAVKEEKAPTTLGPELAKMPVQQMERTARAAILDCLKAEGHDKAAAVLYELDPFLRTTLHSRSFLEVVFGMISQSKAERLITKLWNGGSFFHGSETVFMLQLTFRFLVGPDTKPKGVYLANKGRLSTMVKKLSRAAVAPSVPMENEGMLLAGAIAAKIDLARIELLKSAQTNDSADLEARLSTARRLKSAAQDKKKEIGKASDIAEWVSARWLHKYMRRAATRALAFLAAAKKTRRILTNRKTPPDAQDKTDLRALLAEAPFKLVPPLVSGVAKTLLQLQPDGKLPEPTEYNKRIHRVLRAVSSKKNVKGLAKEIEHTRSKQLEVPTALRLARDASGRKLQMSKDKTKEGLASYLIDELRIFEGLLRSYDNKRDRSFVTQFRRAAPAGSTDPVHPSFLGDDVRVAHRHRVAKWLRRFGSALALDGLRDLAVPVLAASEPFGPKKKLFSRLALFGDWVEDKVRPSHLGEIPQIRGAEPFTGFEFGQFYEALFRIDTARKIEKALDDQALAGDPLGNLEPLLNKAYLQSKESFFRPRRFHMPFEQLVWISRESDPTKEIREFRTLFISHPRTQKLLERERANTKKRLDDYLADFAGHFNRGQVQRTGSIFVDWSPGKAPAVWILPADDLFAAWLQQIEPINVAISALLKGKVSVADLRTMDPHKYSQTFTKALKTIDSKRTSMKAISIALRPLIGLHQGEVHDEELKKEVELARRRLRRKLGKKALTGLADAKLLERLSADKEKAQAELDAQVRRALNHERVRRSTKDWRVKIGRFDPTNLRHRLLAHEIAQDIHRFVRRIPFGEDRPFHLALATLEVADLLHAKFGRFPKLDTARAWVPLIDFTVDLVEKGKLPDNFELLESEREVEHQSVRDARKKRLKSFFFGTEDDAFVQARLAKLKLLKPILVKKLKANQKNFGIDGIGGQGTTQQPGHVQNLSGFRKYDASKPFTISGRRWRVLQVLKSFRFHPAVVTQAAKDFSTGGGKRILFPLNRAGKKRRGEIGADETLFYVSFEDRGRAEQTIAVTRTTLMPGSRTLLLRQFADDLQLAARVGRLSDFVGAMEAGAELMMDAAEFIPGGGQALAVTRILAAFAQMSSDLPQLITSLLKDPATLIKRVGTELGRILSPDFLIEALLFGTKSFKLKTKADSKSKGRAAKFRKGRVRKVLDKLLSIGRGLQNALGRLQRLVHGKKEQLQGFLLGKPEIFKIMRMLVRNYSRLRAMGSSAFAAVMDGADAFRDRVTALTSTLSKITLPETIIRVDDVVNLVIELVGRRLGGKYKAGVKILLDILEIAGEKKRIVTEIGDVVRKIFPGAEKTLNAKWKALANTHLVPKLTKFYAGAHDTLRRILAFVGVTVPKRDGPFKIVWAGTELPGPLPNEHVAFPFGLHGPRQASLSFRQADLLGGASLPNRVLASEELRFGQDLSHVRLHQNQDSDRLVESTGAQGLTTGSRIFLPRALSIDMGPGRKVLRHEIGHVLHQSGSRPLNEKHPAKPVEGRPGRGLVFDPAKERVADRLAADATEGKSLRTTAAAPDGFQPAVPNLEDPLLKFLNKLMDVRTAKEAAAGIDKHGVGSRLIDKAVKDRAELIVSSLRKQLKKSESVKKASADPFKDKSEVFANHLTSSAIWKKIAEASVLLAIESSKPVVGNKKHKTGMVAMQLKEGVFQARLSNYILGATGIRIAFKVSAKKKDVRDPVVAAGIRFVYLPDQHGNSVAWANLPDKDSKARNRTLNDVLTSMGIDLDVFQKNTYALSDKVHAEVAELKGRDSKNSPFPPARLPSPEEYGKHDGTKTISGVGHIGLRVGTHHDLTSGGKQYGAGRNSHHLPQYVLSEYFHGGKTEKGTKKALNDVSRRAFKIDLSKYPSAYPGLEPKGTGHNFTSFTGTKKIEFGKLEAKRGGVMPAISLAAETHQRGALHITNKWMDDPKKGLTQAEVVDARFTELLDDKVADAHSLAQKDYDEHGPAWEKLWKQSGRKNFYDAILQTIEWVRAPMLRQLKIALNNEEISYYNRIASKDTSRMSGKTLKDENQLRWKDIKGAYEKIETKAKAYPF